MPPIVTIVAPPTQTIVDVSLFVCNYGYAQQPNQEPTMTAYRLKKIATAVIIGFTAVFAAFVATH